MAGDQGRAHEVAFVLGGGGVLGAHEVGMLQALAEAGVRPDLVLGTSVGALNGVFVAAHRDPGAAVPELAAVWREGVTAEAFGGSLFGRVRTLARSGTHLHSNEPLRQLLEGLPVQRIEELALPFQCVAASIERAAAHWFSDGPIVPAVLASAAVPGLLPPVRVGDEHFFDGGLVHSIPIGRALELGARTVYVLHVGRIERPLQVPSRPWEVGLVAFEIARRHRFAEDMAAVPPGVTVHVLPAGADAQAGVDLSQLRYRDTSRVDEHIQRAYEASAAYLAGVRRADCGREQRVLPPRIVRRLVLAPLVLVITLFLITGLPVLLLLAAAASPLLPGRWRALRLLWFGLVWLAMESVALFACLALWIASGFGGRLQLGGLPGAALRPDALVAGGGVPGGHPGLPAAHRDRGAGADPRGGRPPA